MRMPYTTYERNCERSQRESHAITDRISPLTSEAALPAVTSGASRQAPGPAEPLSQNPRHAGRNEIVIYNRLATLRARAISRAILVALAVAEAAQFAAAKRARQRAARYRPPPDLGSSG